jgi:polyisoprenoid-binding protein YceI
MSYKLDLAHSQIQFSVRHMMISKARGGFEKFDAVINLDEANPANTTVEVEIETASINTREGQRDAHLRSGDFLDVEHYPHMTFKSTRVEVVDSMHAKLHGDLTIKGTTKPVVLDVEFLGSAKSPWGSTSYGFSGHTVINRKDWNLTWNVALETGGVLVGDEITIDIELELVKVPEQQAETAASA